MTRICTRRPEKARHHLQIDKDSSVYVGIDNLFNHRDDDQAFMERVYKFGVNLKFGSDGSVKTDAPTVEKAKEMAREKLSGKENADWFIKAPFDTTKEQGVKVIGDYRARWNSFTGKVKPSEARVTTTASVGSAYKNYLEKADHGFEQRLRLGVDARIGDNTNVTILGSASGMSGVDTTYDKSDSKGLNHQRVENIDVTQHVNKWDFSVGRLTEPMGVTGYWFGKEYDGGRAVWTSGKNQVRLGYGDFSHSTGIKDSAYTHATKQIFYRTPTKEEWLGFERAHENPYDTNITTGFHGDGVVNVPGGYKGLYQQLAEAASLEEQKTILNTYLDIIDQYGGGTQNDTIGQIRNGKVSMSLNTFAWKKVTVKKGTQVIGTYLVPISGGSKSFSYDDSFDQEVLQQAGEDLWNAAADTLETVASSGRLSVSSNGNSSQSFLLAAGSYTTESEFYGYGRYTGNQIIQPLSTSMSGIEYTAGDVNGDIEFFDANDPTGAAAKETARQNAITSLWNAENGFKTIYGVIYDEASRGIYNLTGTVPGAEISYAALHALEMLTEYSTAHGWWPENYSTMPLKLLEQLGIIMPYYGTVLVQDQIPSIDRAAFVQYKHQMGDHFGVQAWYLRSVNDDTHSIAYAHGDSNDVYSYDRLANIIGLGAAWRVGDNLRFSFDWGQNRTDFGRMMNGSTIYSHESGTSDFDIEGRAKGGTPRFWVARVDVGHADMDKPGSWNAFADYKYFQHGSFFGGNGTEALPDRYLDGIKSFTIGGGYVSAKDFLIEAFYTFDAKGIGKRDTLYGSENFTLGDYTRIQATFRF